MKIFAKINGGAMESVEVLRRRTKAPRFGEIVDIRMRQPLRGRFDIEVRVNDIDESGKVPVFHLREVQTGARP